MEHYLKARLEICDNIITGYYYQTNVNLIQMREYTDACNEKAAIIMELKDKIGKDDWKEYWLNDDPTVTPKINWTE